MAISAIAYAIDHRSMVVPRKRLPPNVWEEWRHPVMSPHSTPAMHWPLQVSIFDRTWWDWCVPDDRAATVLSFE